MISDKRARRSILAVNQARKSSQEPLNLVPERSNKTGEKWEHILPGPGPWPGRRWSSSAESCPPLILLLWYQLYCLRLNEPPFFFPLVTAQIRVRSTDVWVINLYSTWNMSTECHVEGHMAETQQPTPLFYRLPWTKTIVMSSLLFRSTCRRLNRACDGVFGRSGMSKKGTNFTSRNLGIFEFLSEYTIQRPYFIIE